VRMCLHDLAPSRPQEPDRDTSDSISAERCSVSVTECSSLARWWMIVKPAPTHLWHQIVKVALWGSEIEAVEREFLVDGQENTRLRYANRDDVDAPSRL